MAELAPFATDGCSGYVSWAWRKAFKAPHPWEPICVRHDRGYHVGGPLSKRWLDDAELAGFILWFGELDRIKWRARGVRWRIALSGLVHWLGARAFWIGVRLGGVPCLPTPWRWGYGHPWPQW